MVRPRVFVSSVVKGFESYREAARRGIEKGGGEAVLVNEDFPAMAVSSRNACLDAIDSSDVYLVLVGARAGFETPSGRLVVEEEYDHARDNGLPILAFLQDCDRDEKADQLAKEISDYVTGHFRRTFSNPEELEDGVGQSVSEMIPGFQNPVIEMKEIEEKLERPYIFQHEASIRIIFEPERAGEVVDPVTIASTEFRDTVLEIGHRRDVRLFNFERGKEFTVRKEGVVVFQDEGASGRGTSEPLRLEINDDGCLVIDAAVTGRVRRGREHGMLDSFVIAIEDVEEVLFACFRFSGSFYEYIDPYARYSTMFYNVVLRNVEHRSLERNPQDRNSFTMLTRDYSRLHAFDDRRRVARQSLQAPESEIKRIIAVFERKLGGN